MVFKPSKYNYSPAIALPVLYFHTTNHIKQISTTSNPNVYQEEGYTNVRRLFMEMEMGFPRAFADKPEVLMIPYTNKFFKEILMLKLSLLNKADLKNQLDYLHEHFEDGTTNSMDNFIKLLDDNFITDLSKFQFIWKTRTLSRVIEQWKNSKTNKFQEAAYVVKITIPLDLNLLFYKGLKPLLAKKSQKQIKQLLSGTLDKPIDINTSAAQLAVSINHLKINGFLSTKNHQQIALWTSHCFRTIANSKNNIYPQYNHPSSRTIVDIFNSLKRIKLLRKDNFFKDLIKK